MKKMEVEPTVGFTVGRGGAEFFSIAHGSTKVCDCKGGFQDLPLKRGSASLLRTFGVDYFFARGRGI